MPTLEPLPPLMSARTLECRVSFAVGAKLKPNNRSVRVVRMSAVAPGPLALSSYKFASYKFASGYRE